MNKFAPLAVVFATALALTACSDAVIDPNKTPQTETATVTATPTEAAEPVETEEPAEETTEAAEETVEAAATGTRKNPGKIGKDVATFSEADVPVWDVSIGEVSKNANKELLAENMFNELEGEGTVFVMVELNVEYLGTESADAWIDLQPSIVTASGRSYDPASAVVPDSISDVATMYEGGKASGNVAFEVPKDEVVGSTIAIDYGYSDSTLFFGPIK